MNQLIIEEPIQIELSGETYLLEKGDAVLLESFNTILLESPLRRQYLKVEDGDDVNYYAPPSASDGYLLKFMKRLCERLNCKYNISIVRKLPNNECCRSLQYFMNELIPEKR